MDRPTPPIWPDDLDDVRRAIDRRGVGGAAQAPLEPVAAGNNGPTESPERRVTLGAKATPPDAGLEP
jgi:hypothetical protein